MQGQVAPATLQGIIRASGFFLNNISTWNYVWPVYNLTLEVFFQNFISFNDSVSVLEEIIAKAASLIGFSWGFFS